MKIAVTGGAGFIGSHLVRAYLDAGHDVLVIDNLANGLRSAVDARARFYNVDIRDGKLQTILQRERPDLVSHHAAQREYDHPGEHSLIDADVHVRGLLNVLDGCVNASVQKVIFASGGNSLYGRLDKGHAPVTESMPLCPQRPSDISKVAGEWYVRYYTNQYGLSHTILRYADVYGEQSWEQAQHSLTYLIHFLLEDRKPTLRCLADDVRDHIFIDDVVRANLCALEKGLNQTLHISSGQGFKMKQFSDIVAQILGRTVDPVYISSSLAEPTTIALANRLAQHMLGWYPVVDLAEGVKQSIMRLAEQHIGAEVYRMELAEVNHVATALA